MISQWRLFMAAPRFVALAGIAVGLVGAAAYWLAAQLWPTSVAVVVSMSATMACTGSFAQASSPDARAAHPAPAVLLLLIKYNALMALSAAKSPLPLPEYLTLGLIMVAGHAVSRALALSLMATRAPTGPPVTSVDLGVALTVGLAPAVLLGIPGLVGLVAAIAMSLAQNAAPLRTPASNVPPGLDMVRQLTEACFYLGALATWRYV